MASGTIGRPLSDKIEFIDIPIGNVSGETVLDKMQRAVSDGFIPTGKTFIGVLSSGSRYFVAGHVYRADNALYGFMIVGWYNGYYIYRINNDVWSA